MGILKFIYLLIYGLIPVEIILQKLIDKMKLRHEINKNECYFHLVFFFFYYLLTDETCKKH